MILVGSEDGNGYSTIDVARLAVGELPISKLLDWLPRWAVS